MYNIRRATSGAGGEDVWCEEKVSSIKNVTSPVRGEKVCSTRRIASVVREEGCAM